MRQRSHPFVDTLSGSLLLSGCFRVSFLARRSAIGDSSEFRRSVMRFILGLLIGVALGTALGRLAPPQSGNEIRQALKQRLQPDAEEANDGVTVG